MKKLIKIEIENKPEQSILVELLPLENKIKIYGKYKPKNEAPINIIVSECNYDSVEENLIEIIHETAVQLNNRINRTNELYSIIKQIEKIEIINNS